MYVGHVSTLPSVFVDECICPVTRFASKMCWEDDKTLGNACLCVFRESHTASTKCIGVHYAITLRISDVDRLQASWTLKISCRAFSQQNLANINAARVLTTKLFFEDVHGLGPFPPPPPATCPADLWNWRQSWTRRMFLLCDPP